MICMGVDSSGKTAAIALMQDEKVLYEEFINAGLTHSQTLLPMMARALDCTGLSPAQIDLYAVSAGPGSFTGLRIGLAAVKGMAQPFSTPCAGVSTLEALSWNISCQGTVISVLDARRGEVYWAAFSLPGCERLTPDAAQPVGTIEGFLKNCKNPVFFVGDGAGLCYNRYDMRAQVIPCPAPLRQSRALGVCLAAEAAAAAGEAVSAAALAPRYLRLSQAERERAARGM